MDDTLNCLLLNTKRDKCLPSDYVSRYHLHIMVRRGSMSFVSNDNVYTGKAKDLVLWVYGDKYEAVSYSADFDADFLAYTQDLFGQFNMHVNISANLFSFIRFTPVIHLNVRNQRIIDHDFAMFRKRIDQQHSPYRHEILGQHVRILFYDLCGICQQHTHQTKVDDITARMFLDFRIMVSKEAYKHRKVEYYADQLCMTSKNLSQISKAISGRTATQWISFYAKNELIRMLDDRKLSLRDIAREIGFENQSSFSRYATKILGTSPSEYRSKLTV